MSGYSERDAADIIRRAAEKQQGETPTESLSLEDLERIAGELGIDPKHVRAAARDLPTENSLETVRFQRTLSAELDDATWATLVDRVRARYGVGATSQVGATREWASQNASLSVTGRKLTLRVDRSSSVWGAIVPSIAFALILSIGFAQIGARFAGAPGAIAGVVILLSSVYFLLKFAMGAWTAKNTREIEALADELARSSQPAEKRGLHLPETGATAIPEGEVPYTDQG